MHMKEHKLEDYFELVGRVKTKTIEEKVEEMAARSKQLLKDITYRDDEEEEEEDYKACYD